ncbi:DegV family protein [Ligilactobacillus ceti]|uniref:DegV family protein n=1 Tax=Ligilactobacillus ceti DSM 22408 TaxID=1122146 RepID=A0A0R2KHG7_9LACO|nr:DegV family protein [Ligilactobacillus ceti]KRN88835.1 DegV family protein [Ligilactobacillus ceti DSM 22408]
MKIAVVTDSTAYLTQEQAEKYNIHVVPMPFVLDGETYEEGVNITTEDFYYKLKNSKNFPNTSQPPVGEMIKLYKSLAEQGYDTVISIHLSSTISGFVQTLENLKEELTEIDIVPFDSEITVILMGMMAIAASKLAAQGASVAEIMNKLEELRQTTGEWFVVDDLQNLVRGGRLSNASAFIGSVLKIKPILTFDNSTHKIFAYDKVRSTKRALNRAEELFANEIADVNYPIHLFVIHANNEEAAMKWRDQLVKKFPDMKISISHFGPVVGTHLGDKALALGWIEDVEA